MVIKNQINIVTRLKVFETNSSSCHSIVYTKTKFSKINPNYIYGQEIYGWSGPDVDTASDKLDYLIIYTSMQNSYLQNSYLQSIINVIKKEEGEDFILQITNSECNTFENINVKDIVIKETNCEGYIDHQSDDTLEYLFKSDDIEKELYKFIYGDTVILIRNDNTNYEDNK